MMLFLRIDGETDTHIHTQHTPTDRHTHTTKKNKIKNKVTDLLRNLRLHFLRRDVEAGDHSDQTY